MGNVGLNKSVPWVNDNQGTLCFICKEDIKNLDDFLSECPNFEEMFSSIPS